MADFPQFVLLGDTALTRSQLLGNDTAEYSRIAGAWSLYAKFDAQGFLLVDEPAKSSKLHHVHGHRLIETTEEVHKKDNEGY